MKKLVFTIMAIMTFLGVLLNHSLIHASVLSTVHVEIITKPSVPIWSESVQGNGREDFFEAVQSCKDGKYSEALELFSSLKDKYPGSNAAEIAGLYIGSILFWNATSKNGNGNGNGTKDIKLLMEALKAFQEGLTSSIKSNNVPEILFETGKVYLEMGRTDEAVGSFRRVIRDYHKSRYAAEAQYMLSLTLEKNAKYNEAMDGYRILIKEYPEYLQREGLFGIGRVFFEMREYGEAKKVYEDGLNRWPSYVKGNPEILFNYSESQFQNGVIPEAREGFLIYYNLYPKTKNSGLALSRVGDTYVLERKAIVAENIYREVLALFPAGEDAVRSKLAIG
ncbi:MAG: tetratricopeptide repeat protein, partial [Nitrospira sp.]|nr:tetratricopeptide repeat protein [Nitrospira sp.]